MSQTSAVAEHAAGIDWSVAATGAAVFIGTLVTTVWGWFQGKKKVEQQISSSVPSGNVSSAILMDTQGMRDNTTALNALRDQQLLIHHAMVSQCKAVEDNTSAMDDILSELKALRRSLEQRGLT